MSAGFWNGFCPERLGLEAAAYTAVDDAAYLRVIAGDVTINVTW